MTPTITIPGLAPGATSLTMAWIPYAKGACPRAVCLPGIAMDDEAVALWDDGSVRVSHLWGEFGNDGQTTLTGLGGEFPDIAWVGKAPVVRELRGTATCDHVGKVLRDTPFRRVTYFEGPLKQPGVLDYAYRRTWVTSFRGHDTILIDHSITWIRPMKDYRVETVSFQPPNRTDTAWQWGVHESGGDVWNERGWWNGDGWKKLGEPLTWPEQRQLVMGIPTGEFTENTMEAYQMADLHGTSIRDRWAFDGAFKPWPATGRCDDAWIEASGVLGDVSCGSKDPVDKYIVDMAKSFHAKATPGRFTQGNPPTKWVVKENRPSAHRPGIGSYFCWGETLWTETARQGGEELARCARLMADHTVQFGQCAATGYGMGLDKWHVKGRLWKNGEPVGNPPGMNESDNWSAHFGRSPDPISLHYAWVFDGDQRAQWGFNLWRDTADFNSFTGGRNRESSKTIGMAADVCEWYPEQRAKWQPYLNQLVNVQVGTPGWDQWPNSLWDPLLVQKALPHCTADNKERLLAWAKTWRAKMRSEGVTKNQDTEAMALSTLDGRPNVLREHLNPIAHKVHVADGVGPGALGDDFIARQWGHYRKALERAQIPVDLTRSWPARIPVANLSFGDVGNIGRRGTKILVRAVGSQLAVTLHGISVAADPAPCTWVVTDTAGARIASGDWRFEKLGARVMSTGGYALSLAIAVPAPDANYFVCMGGHALELVWPVNALEVLLPAGTYWVRAPNKFHLKPSTGLGVIPSIVIASESKESWVDLKPANGPKMRSVLGGPAVGMTPEADGFNFDITAGTDPQARMLLTHDMCLERNL